jgi:hypothetical protein
LAKKIINHKYIKNGSFFYIKHKQSDSAIWTDLLKVKNIYLQGWRVMINNGEHTIFWKDTWLYDKPLCVLFPDLFKFCDQQNILVEQARKETHTISFSRWLMDSLLLDSHRILSDMNKLDFGPGEDRVSGNLVLWAVLLLNLFTML